jgi:phage antirepressor YoqD-like protein
MVETELLLKRNLRDEVMNDKQLEVLDSVRKIIYLGNSNYSTVEQVANYYEVGIEAIKSTGKRNKEELEDNGMKYYKKSEILLMVQCEPIEIPNRGTTLFTKRAILNLGMLLEESSVAKEVRTLLLDNHFQLQDVHEKLVNGEEIEISKTSPTYFIDKEINLREKEKELKTTMTDAIINGDMDSYLSISCQVNNIKEQIIALGKEKEELFKPKVDLYNKFLDSNSTYSFTDTSKMISTLAKAERSDISITVTKLTEFLRDKGILCKTKTPDKVKNDGSVKKGKYKNLPNKNYEDMFDTISVKVNNFNTVQTRVKSSGVEFIYEELKKSKQAV